MINIEKMKCKIDLDSQVFVAEFYYAGNAQYYIFLLCVIFRLYKNRHLGQYNLIAPRPKTYLLKIFLQALMAADNFILVWD